MVQFDKYVCVRVLVPVVFELLSWYWMGIDVWCLCSELMFDMWWYILYYYYYTLLLYYTIIYYIILFSHLIYHSFLFPIFPSSSDLSSDLIFSSVLLSSYLFYLPFPILFLLSLLILLPSQSISSLPICL